MLTREIGLITTAGTQEAKILSLFVSLIWKHPILVLYLNAKIAW
jgi:hypothetical protein